MKREIKTKQDLLEIFKKYENDFLDVFGDLLIGFTGAFNTIAEEKDEIACSWLAYQIKQIIQEAYEKIWDKEYKPTEIPVTVYGWPIDLCKPKSDKDLQ